MESCSGEGGDIRAPAEWERHSCTWIAWPHNDSTFPPPIIWKVEETYCEMVYELSRGEVVKILVNDGKEADHVTVMLEQVGVRLSSVELLTVPTVDVWVRDYAPLFAKSESRGLLAAVKWRFNTWGMKYPELALDDSAGREILRLSGAKPFYRPYVVEGGAIEVSGDGILMTTKSCLLDPARNPGVTREEMEMELRRYLGAKRVLWFDEGLVGDDTDGHVDVFCRFTSPSTVVLAEERGEGVNRRILERAYKRLAGFREETGLELETLRAPCPPMIQVLDQRILASYLNFYIGNESVLVPVFGVREDEEALSILSECFKHRRVVGIRSGELFYGLGGFTASPCSSQRIDKVSSGCEGYEAL